MPSQSAKAKKLIKVEGVFNGTIKEDVKTCSFAGIGLYYGVWGCIVYYYYGHN